MMKKNLIIKAAVGLIGVASVVPFAGAQAQEDWEMPRTSDGYPSLEGHWGNTTVVPLQRPVELGNKAFYTPEEAFEFSDSIFNAPETEFGTEVDVHYQFDEFSLEFSEHSSVENVRTSLITDPPNGRIPPLKPEAIAIAAERKAWREVHGLDNAAGQSNTERCLVWSTQGPPMLPVGYNSNYHIIQTTDYVVILMEMIHDARIIPLEGHVPETEIYPQWLGNSRAHWEGDTLVINSTGLSGETNARGFEPPLNPEAKITEWITRVSDDRLEYKFTVEDPKLWDQVWGGEYPMKSVVGPMFEYACHEGNYSMINNLNAARIADREAAEVNQE
jgi:hypothetical protein